MAEFTPRVVKRTAIGFHPTVLPTVYDDALSYYEELNKILHSLNDAIEVIDENRALILQLDANVKELDARLTAQIKQVADDLAALRKEYESFRDEVQAKIAELVAKDKEQDGRLTAVETKNTQQDQRLTAIETKNTTQDSEISALKTRCTTLETNLTSVTNRVSTLETRLTALTTRVTNAEGYITELQGDVARIDQEQDVQDKRIKALEDAPGGGGVGSQWGTVEVYQLFNNDASNGSLTNTHFVRHVDLQDNKYNILLNTGSCNSAVPLGTLFTHKDFTVPGQPEVDELIITSWDPAVCNPAAITAIKELYTIKHAWIPSSINWTNYTGADKETVKAVEAAVIKALNENGTTEFTRMGDTGSIIEVGAITFDCLYDPTRYGVTSANMVCRIHCNSDMVVVGNDDITEVAKNSAGVRNWFPNMMAIDVPSSAYVVPKYTLDKVSKNVLTHISYDQSGETPAGYAPYMGLQWCNKAGGESVVGYASMINLGGDVPRLTPTSKTVYVPSVGSGVDVYNVKTFGAVGDGVTDDTVAINACLEAADVNRVRNVVFPAGTYLVSANKADSNFQCAINAHSNQNLVFEGATLKLAPNAHDFYAVINIHNVSNVVVCGAKIVGDRESHTGTTGESGHGIRIVNSSNILVSDADIRYTWGDGICVAGNGTMEEISDGVTLERIYTYKCSRNGLSVIEAENVIARDCDFTYTDRIDPQYGVDIEPNLGTANNIVLDNVRMLHNGIGGLSITARKCTQRGAVRCTNIVTDKKCTIHTTGTNPAGVYDVTIDGWNHTQNADDTIPTLRLSGEGMLWIAQLVVNNKSANKVLYPFNAKHIRIDGITVDDDPAVSTKGTLAVEAASSVSLDNIVLNGFLSRNPAEVTWYSGNALAVNNVQDTVVNLNEKLTTGGSSESYKLLMCDKMLTLGTALTGNARVLIPYNYGDINPVAIINTTTTPVQLYTAVSANITFVGDVDGGSVANSVALPGNSQFEFTPMMTKGLIFVRRVGLRIPTSTSDLTNNSGFATEGWVDNAINSAIGTAMERSY